MSRLTNRKVIESFRRTGGLVSLAARQLGCSRQAIYKRVNKYPAVAEALNEEREVFLDVCEAKLRQQVDRGDMRAIEFVLRTLGRSRGFSDKVELEHRGGQDVRIHVVYGECGSAPAGTGDEVDDD